MQFLGNWPMPPHIEKWVIIFLNQPQPNSKYVLWNFQCHCTCCVAAVCIDRVNVSRNLARAKLGLPQI
jgi:hypothetical protein